MSKRQIFIDISIILIHAGARPTNSKEICNYIPEIKEALDNAIKMDLQRNAAVQKNALQSAAQMFNQANQQAVQANLKRQHKANLQREHNLARKNVSTGTLFAQPNERSRSRTRRSNMRHSKRRKTRRRS